MHQVRSMTVTSSWLFLRSSREVEKLLGEISSRDMLFRCRTQLGTRNSLVYCTALSREIWKQTKPNLTCIVQRWNPLTDVTANRRCQPFFHVVRRKLVFCRTTKRWKKECETCSSNIISSAGICERIVTAGTSPVTEAFSNFRKFYFQSGRMSPADPPGSLT